MTSSGQTAVTTQVWLWEGPDPALLVPWIYAAKICKKKYDFRFQAHNTKAIYYIENVLLNLITLVLRVTPLQGLYVGCGGNAVTYNTQIVDISQVTLLDDTSDSNNPFVTSSSSSRPSSGGHRIDPSLQKELLMLQNTNWLSFFEMKCYICTNTTSHYVLL